MGGTNENERVASPEVVYENSRGFEQSVSLQCSGIKLLQLAYSLSCVLWLKHQNLTRKLVRIPVCTKHTEASSANQGFQKFPVFLLHH